MAHELTLHGKRAEMAYVGDEPWHGLGQRLTDDAPIDTWIAEAGMAWRIQRSKVRYCTAIGGPTVAIPEQHVLFRSDTKAALGVVGHTYQVVQPAAVLEFFRDIVSPGGFALETAGTMFGGRKYWALARTGDKAPVIGQDVVGGYLLLTSSCDGGSATEAFYTTVRVVCNNTLRMALGSKMAAKARISIRHSTKFDPASVKDALGIAHGAFGEFITSARTLAAKPVDATAAADLTLWLLNPANAKALPSAQGTELKTVQEKLERTRNGDAYQRILSLFNGTGKGATLKGAQGTGWGWLNAVTEYADHHRKVTSVDHRWDSAIAGAGADLKDDAYALILAR